MCGIAAVVGVTETGYVTDVLQRMNRAQQHRGPDGEGVALLTGGGLGHRRLSIIDLSARAGQPMWSVDGLRCITYNGEIYNYRELRQQLSSYPFSTRSDTEVVLAAYERWGHDCVKHFIGQFAFALWDENKQELFCSRDRLGIKPLFFAFHQGGFYVASEIKALLAGGVPARPNMTAWADYLTGGSYDPHSETFFEGISSLPAGCNGVYQLNSLPSDSSDLLITRYWSLDLDQEQKDSGGIVSQWLEQARDAVGLTLRSDVAVGLNLSGGLDSSTLTWLVDQVWGRAEHVKTFTAAFNEPEYNEYPYVVALHNQHEHYVSYIDQQVTWDALPMMMWHQEAPFGGVATMAYYFLHQHARDVGIKVVLEGQGVDELLAGYDYYRLPRQAGIYQDGTAYLRAQCVSPALRHGATADDLPGITLSDRLYHDLCYNKIPRVLRMNDRLSMAHGVELREPFLDHRLVELSFQIPEYLKVRDGTGKWLLREGMKGKLPDVVRLAPKRAVVTPQREWLRGPWQGHILEILHSHEFRSLDWFDVAVCQREYQRYCDGVGDNSFFIWQWVNALLWARQFTNLGR